MFVQVAIEACGTRSATPAGTPLRCPL